MRLYPARWQYRCHLILDGVNLDRPGVGATGGVRWPSGAHRFHGAGSRSVEWVLGTLCIQWRPSAPNLRQLAPAGLPTEAKGGPPLGRSFVVDRAARRTVAGGSVDGPRETTMTKHADFKGRVRARMAKTGESYATARIQCSPSSPMLKPLARLRMDGGGVACQQR